VVDGFSAGVWLHRGLYVGLALALLFLPAARGRALAPAELAQARTGFDDARLAELLLRYRARNFPDTLSPAERARWETHRAARLLAGEGGALTIPALFDRIDVLVETVESEPGQSVLEALYAWAEQLAPDC